VGRRSSISIAEKKLEPGSCKQLYVCKQLPSRLNQNLRDLL
jgi:hypothetical protein